MTTRNRKNYDSAVIESVIKWADLTGYKSLEESNANMAFVGRGWFNLIADLVNIYDTTLDLINESELLATLTFIYNDEFYKIAYLARYTEAGIRGYTDDFDEIYGSAEDED